MAIYVSPKGNNNNPGTIDLPFLTLTRSGRGNAFERGQRDTAFRRRIFPFTARRKLAGCENPLD